MNYGSGVCISDRYVLSARHVSGVDIPTGFTLPGGPTRYSIPPTTRFPVGAGFYDLALMDFGPGAFTTYYPIFEDYDATSYVVTCVGYGLYGTYSPTDAWGWTPIVNSWFQQRRAGRNQMLRDASAGSVSSMGCDFDTATSDNYDHYGDGNAIEDECQFLFGDSGGPSFVYSLGQWKLLGIHNSIGSSNYFYPATNYGYGARSFDFFVPFLLAEIRDAMNQ